MQMAGLLRNPTRQKTHRGLSAACVGMSVRDRGAGDGDRTRTALSGHRILSPVRMPVSPLLQRGSARADLTVVKSVVEAIQLLDGLGLVLRAQMTVVLHHPETPPAADLHHRLWIDPGHRQPRRERVP